LIQVYIKTTRRPTSVRLFVL